MKETKKEYHQPAMTIVEIDSADIIAESPGAGEGGGYLPPILEE